MKLITIFIFALCLHASARTNAQKVTLVVKNQKMEQVLRQIKQQTGYLFIYNDKDIAKAQPVNVAIKDMLIGDALDKILEGQSLAYEIKVNTIFITPKKTAPPTPTLPNENAAAPLPPAGIDVTVTVIGADNSQTLEGASVMIKGNNKGVATDVNGRAVLKDVDPNATIVISFTGYKKEEVKLAGRNTVVVKLAVNTNELQEVIINKGYYTEQQRFSVGNVSTVKAADIEKQPVQNPLLALQGRVPGLEITQTTGINGGAVQVRIQGINSISSIANNPLSRTEPLIIVDGVPYPTRFSINTMEFITQGGSPLNYINPSDIESISVLKDADATAIYGSRAANGAILITTKKGKAGKPKLSIDLQQGWGKVTRHVDMMNTRQYLDMRYEALKNDGINTIPSSNYDLTVWDTTRYTNWQKELIGGTAQYTNVNAGVSGGTNLVQYLVGANYNRQTTVFPGDYNNKSGGMHFSLNGNSPNQKLRIQLSGSYSYNDNSLPGNDLTRSAVLLEPNAPKLYNEDGSLNWALNPSGSSTWNNPMAGIIYADYSNVTKNLLSSMNISYSILRGLVISSNFGYNNLQSELFQSTKLEFNSPENRPTAQRSASFGNRNVNSWIIEPQLQFEKNIGKGRLDALIGSTIQKLRGDYLHVNASGQPTDELLHSLAAATTVRSGASGNNLEYTTRFNGFFGRIGYNWDKKYLVNLTGRRDGSSKFGEGNKFHNFWSAGAGWIFSDEKWLHSALPFLSFGKLRVSYGTTGNDQIADYSYLSLYNIVNTNILYQETTSFNVAGLSNPFLQWEETRKLQAGIDLSAFNERIALGITYARNRSSNQLIGYSLPSLTGFTSYTKNFPATVQNTSWEFSLNTENVKSKNFSWNTNFNLTIPRNKVISFPGIELTSYASGSLGIIIGEPIGIQKKYQYGGVDPATGSYMLLDTLGKAVVPGSFGAIKQSARVSLLPKYYGGLSNSISYKGFQLDFLIQFVYQIGSKDNYYFNEASTPPGAFSNGNGNQPVGVLNRWQKPGDNAAIGRYNSDYSLTILPPYSDGGYSYAAGSYIRLKNVSLSWQLPDAWSKRAHLQTAKLYFRGQNLATITGYKGLDPETRSVGTLPPLQMWTVGARIEL